MHGQKVSFCLSLSQSSREMGWVSLGAAEPLGAQRAESTAMQPCSSEHVGVAVVLWHSVQ